MSSVPDPDVCCYPYGYDEWVRRGPGRVIHTEVTPKPPPPASHVRWTIGPFRPKTHQPEPGPSGTPATGNEEITVQLTADQQVELSISGEDAYDNPVEISGDVVWLSSDESIVGVLQDPEDQTKALAWAVGPTGTAAVTVTNDVDQDGSGDFQGSLAIDVVAGDLTEIVIDAGEATDKDDRVPHPDQGLPGAGSEGGAHPDNTLPGRGSAGGEHPDNTLPGDQPRPDHTLPGDLPQPK